MNTGLHPERVQTLRKQHRWSQARLAREMTALGAPTAASHISALEGGHKGLGANKIAALAAALSTNTNYLLGLSDDPSPVPNLNERVSVTVQDPVARRHIQSAITLMATQPAANIAYAADLLGRLFEPPAPALPARPSRARLSATRKEEERIEEAIRSLTDAETYDQLMQLVAEAVRSGNTDALLSAARAARARRALAPAQLGVQQPQRLNSR
jgi:transcriptional regulator with XRE-family HTH domain